jgi:riboflavin synthase
MFTGLIEEVGRITSFERLATAARLAVAVSFSDDVVRLGDSIAVNGVCLTVVAAKGGAYYFDASPETLEHTAFRRLKSGDRVNLERALRLGDRLGGHIVTGHVDCVATLTDRREVSNNIIFSFRVPTHAVRYLVAKGSVTIDGISLTVNRVDESGFSVNVIPHTALMTTLPEKRMGDEVNIETDIIGKYLERLVSGRGMEESGGVTFDLLAKNGFL